MTFTISQVWAVILSVCGGIVTISAAVSIGFKIRDHFKKPNIEQNEEIAKLKNRQDNLESELKTTKAEFMQFFKNDKNRLDAIEEGNRYMQRAMLALLSNTLDGNHKAQVEKARDDLRDYLIER